MREASFVSGFSAAKLRDAGSSQIAITYTSGGLFFSNKAVGEGQWYGGTKLRLWALTQGRGDRSMLLRKAFFPQRAQRAWRSAGASALEPLSGPAGVSAGFAQIIFHVG
jgi:hypothetical protein